MTEAQQAELKALRDMTETLGWTAFVRAHSEQAQNMRVSTIDVCKTPEQLNYQKGFIAALEGIVNYEKLLDGIEEADRAAQEQEASAPPV